MVTNLYFPVVSARCFFPCTLFPVSQLSRINTCRISFISLCSDAAFSLWSFGAPRARDSRETRTSLGSYRTIFSFISFLSFGSVRAPWARVPWDTRTSLCSLCTVSSFLSFRSLGAPWANFPWDPYSAWWSPLSDSTFISFEAISTRRSRDSWNPWDTVGSWPSWYSSWRIRLLK